MRQPACAFLIVEARKHDAREVLSFFASEQQQEATSIIYRDRLPGAACFTSTTRQNDAPLATIV